MSGPFNMPARARKPSINITPLIDVMFLLLIFFMVSSTFRDYMGIDVDLPEAGTAASQNAEVHEILVNAEGNMFLDGAPTSPDALERSLADLIASEKQATFILRADQAAEFGAVIQAVDIAKKVGGERLIIPTDLPAGEAAAPLQ